MKRPQIDDHDKDHAPLERHFDRLLTPVEEFTRSQSMGGLILLSATLVALYLANSSFRDIYETINHLPFALSLGDWRIEHSLHHWVNDGLMVLFFFVLGMEIKREGLAGDLKDIKQSALVLAMAIGGMLFPALIYAVIAGSGEMLRGWGIPMATDTAFALGLLTLLGNRVPRAATVLLMGLAIVDDIGAVLVIGFFYTESLDVASLVSAFIVLLVLGGFNVLGIRRPMAYLIGAISLWWFIQQSGLHATTAGVLAALMVPSRPYAQTSWFIRKMKKIVRRFESLDEDEKTILEEHRQHHLAEQAQEIAAHTTTPLQHWTTRLDRPVSFVVVPLFAFLNAGVALPDSWGSVFDSTLVLAVIAGLCIGKPLGILLLSWICVRLNWAKLPAEINFGHMAGIGLLAGIGFTMSLFISALAFEGQAAFLVDAKLGILLASLISGCAGTVCLVAVARLGKKTDAKN